MYICVIYIYILLSPKKEGNFLRHATTWTDSDDIMLSETRNKPDKYCIILLA